MQKNDPIGSLDLKLPKISDFDSRFSYESDSDSTQKPPTLCDSDTDSTTLVTRLVTRWKL